MVGKSFVRLYTTVQEARFLQARGNYYVQRGCPGKDVFRRVIGDGQFRYPLGIPLAEGHGETGIEFGIRDLREPRILIGGLLYICNEKVSASFGRVEQAMAAFEADQSIVNSLGSITILGRGRHEEFPVHYTGALGTFVFAIGYGARQCSDKNPIFYAINGVGQATRETPITQQEKGDKANAVVGKRTLMQIVAAGCDLIAKQLSEGQFVIIAAGDNAFAGRIMVGKHPLSEDRHGIVNLTMPERVIGEGVNLENVRKIEQLGILIVDPITGARVDFKEKIPTSQIQTESKRAGGVIDKNTMIKIIRQEIALMYEDTEHYMRPSTRDGQSLLVTYAKTIPDWSKLHDEPTVHSITMQRWMGTPDKKFDRADWRLLWIIANDIVLSSLERIAFEDYFKPVETMQVNWKVINQAALNILKTHGSFDPTQADSAPTGWFFARNNTYTLRNNWKELFLAAMAIKYKTVNVTEEQFCANWKNYCPPGIEVSEWLRLGDVMLEIDRKENGIAAGRIDGLWVDTGTKQELFNTWLDLVHPNLLIRAASRELYGVPIGVAVEETVEGKDYLRFDDVNSIYVGGRTKIVSTQGAQIKLGKNVIVVDSEIVWEGKEDLSIPDNTVIFSSRLHDINNTIQDIGSTLVYRYDGSTKQEYEIDTAQGKKKIQFGFYGGVMFGSMRLEEGQAVHTIFPLQLNLKDKPEMSLIDDYVQNPDLAHHFKAYYASASSVLSYPVPFTNMLASDILKNIA